MNLDTVKSRLSSQIKFELPGKAFQYEMASYHRSNYQSEVTNSAKTSAVTILLYLKNETWFFTLIQRPNYDGPHGGQVALPGGKKDNSDINLKHTAIRETYEEIGVLLNENEIIGELTELYIPVSNSIVTPFVATINYEPSFILQEREVLEVIECRITDLLVQDNKQITSISINENLKIKTPYFLFNDKIVWGATAMMLNEFKRIWHLIEV
jgi:8-oxo-dGTP pyrophosphatase MutT (NUDIX family)